MPHLTLEARYQIEHDIRLGLDNRVIAQGLGRSRRTIEREVRRCGGRADYRALPAQAHRDARAARSAANHPVQPLANWQQIEARILQRHSPEQAKHALALSLSVATIYRYLYRLKKQHLLKRLRHYSAAQKRGGKMAWVHRAESIQQRPKAVLTRDTIGHLECDSIVGKRNEPHKIVVLLDRALRFIRLGLVRDGTAAATARHIARWRDDPRIPILSLTCDQGHEFSALPELLPGRLYACDPGKPYQKGAVENANQLIRQYIPKGKSLRHLTQAKLDWIANELNQRPRKRHIWESPAALLSRLTAAATV